MEWSGKSGQSEGLAVKGIFFVCGALSLLFGCATSPMKTTPFYGGSSCVYTEVVEDSVNVWPIYYSREPMLSVLWPIISFADDHCAVRPFYSQYRHGGAGSAYDEFNVLWPLARFDTRSGESYVFPFFYHDSDSFHSLLYGYGPSDDGCTYSYVTPFFGLRHDGDPCDHRELGGFWLFPLVSRESNSRLRRLQLMMTRDTLDASVKGTWSKRSDAFDRSRTNRLFEVRGEYARNNLRLLMGLASREHEVSYGGNVVTDESAAKVGFRETINVGNALTYYSSWRRTVDYDYVSRKREDESEMDESGVFFDLLWHSKAERRKNRDYLHRSVLWRLWRYERLNGDVSVDVFFIPVRRPSAGVASAGIREGAELPDAQTH